MLPDMSEVLDEFSKEITLRRVTQYVENFRKTETKNSLKIYAVVQPAQKEKINPDLINWSLKYLMVHSKDEIKVGDIIEDHSIEYKAIELGPYQDYGFYEAIFEEIRE